MNAKQNALVLLTGLSLGSSVVMTRLGVSELPPLFLVAARLGLATLLFALTLALLRQKLPTDSRTWIDIFIVGVANTGFPLAAFTIALQFISSGILSIFLALIPLFTGILAHLLLAQEKLTPMKILGLVVAFAGVLLLLATRTTGLAPNTAGPNLLGHLLALTGALFTAASTVYTRLRLRGTDVVVVTAGQFAAGLIVVAPLALLFSHPDFSAITWRGWFVVAYSALIGSYVGFLLFFYMVKRFSATVATLPGYVLPAVSAGLGALILGELISLPLIIGAGLSLLGVYLASR